ncbi:oligosaccharide flippase family protein [Vibrio vulnificus]|uniref:oligosaccharide flippase family protein n=1 Tax=Vibrio vulnificus TaxID=672 RepID=UPI003EDA159A
MLKSNIFRIIKNSGFLLIVQGANYLVPFVILPYLSKNFSQDNFGQALVILSICQLAYIISEFGFNVSLVSKVQSGISNKSLSLLNSDVISIRVLVCLVYVLLLFLFFDSKIESVNLIIIFFTIVFQAAQPIWYFMGIESFKSISKLLLATKIIQVPVFFANLYSGIDPVSSFALSLMLSQLVGALYANRTFYWNIEPRYRKFYFNTSAIELFRSSYGYFFSRIYSTLPYYISSPLIGRVHGMGNAAIFGAGESIGKAIKGFSGSIVQAFYPRISEVKDLKLFIVFYVLSILVLSTVCFIISLCGDFILVLIFGDFYSTSLPYLDLSLVIVVLSFSSNLLGYPLFSMIGKLELVNKSSFYIFVIFIIAMVWFIYEDLDMIYFMYILIFVEFLSSVVKLFLFLRYRIYASLRLS